MYEVFFYAEKNGREPIREYLQELADRADKDSRIKLNKIYEYIKCLSEFGIQSGEPYVKHLDGEIWELRPIRDRILFVMWAGKSFILLCHFMKKTQKTPQRKIEQAKQNLADYRERSKDNEQNG
jgi:phage-related protein